MYMFTTMFMFVWMYRSKSWSRFKKNKTNRWWKSL